MHRDQHEYGYKGAVKVVTREDFQMESDADGNIRVDTVMPLVSYRYYFNVQGNIDSLTAAGPAGSGQVSYYKNVYRFHNNLKSEWTSYSKGKQVLLQGKVTWLSPKEYLEKVTDGEGKPKYETTVTLNDSSRVQQTRIRTFDPTGKLLQDNWQTFHLNTQQQIISYKTKDQVNGIEGQTSYQYVAFDPIGNPLQIIITRPERGVQKMVKLSYTYYE